MHTYRTIIYRLKAGQSIRSIAKDGVMGRHKISIVRELASSKGWLDSEAQLPEEKDLALFFENSKPIGSCSLAQPYADKIESWVKAGVQASVIHLRLSEAYGFKGAYNSIQRFVKKIKAKLPPDLTIPLHFKPGEAAQVDFGAGPMLFDECYLGEFPEHLTFYIDYQAFARDLFINDYFSLECDGEVHIFSHY